MFTEASSPRVYGERAVLQSSVITPATGQCFSFWYHMYGAEMGDLSVFVLSDLGGADEYAIRWSLSGEQSSDGTDWQYAQIGLEETENYQVGVRGYPRGGERGVSLCHQ